MRDASAPRIAVVVVNWNSGGYLERCLDAVARQTLAPARLIVVDNASSDGSADGIERRHPRAELLRLATNTGFAVANNEGARAAAGCEWLALLNPDAFPEPAWLERLAAAAAARPEYSFFASRMLMADAPDRVDGTGDMYLTSGWAARRDHGRPALAAQRPTEEVFAPCAAAAMYGSEAFRGVGGFDDSFFCYFEDVDLAFRLRLAGHRCLYVSDAVVHHVGSGVTGKRSAFAAYHGHRNLVWAFLKNMPWPLLLAYLPLHLALNVASVVWLGLRGQGLVALRAKRDALLGLLPVWRRRRQVQSSRRVSSRSLRASMTSSLGLEYFRSSS